MLITDGIARNLSDIVVRNNHLAGGKTIPVRIFTYLIGKEVTNVDELRWMACANRGSKSVTVINNFKIVFRVLHSSTNIGTSDYGGFAIH
jgi:hypothetical protein